MTPSDMNSKPDASNTNTNGTGGRERPKWLIGKPKGLRNYSSYHGDPGTPFDWQSWLNERLPRVRSEVEQIMSERQP